MNLLSIKLENCFGIGKLEHEFDFGQSNSYVIYAPNGTMKSSFAKTFHLISKNDKKDLPKDLVFGKKAKYEILQDNDTIKPESILVINAEDNSYDATHKITSFLARKELKEKYDQIYAELNNAKSELLKKLKNISKSSDCEVEYTGAFNTETNDNFFEVLSNHVVELSNEPEKIDFKYNHVFDKKGNVKKFINNNQELLDKYVENYTKIISGSKLFKTTGDQNFGTYEANEIIKSIEDNSYFNVGHKFVLEDGTEITDSQQLKDIYQNELKKLLDDETLKESFDKVDKAIGANVELREFKKVIEKDNAILVDLKDYDNFKKRVWTNIVSEVKSDADLLAALYDEKKKDLDIIIKESKEDFELWNEIIRKFNRRFFVPFEIQLANQHDVILKQETAYLQFIFTDKKEDSKLQNRDSLLKILSKGEQRAFFILQFLFEIESRKNSGLNTLLIFDDIADSFDYRNKYAIIEYVAELHGSEQFKSLILTHNFDFYRTIASRLNMNKYAYMTTKDDDRKIEISEGLYKKDVFKGFLKNYQNPKIFISLIAFIRNIVEYTESHDADDCKKLTSCLHEKSDSKNITVGDIQTIFLNRIATLEDSNFELDKNMKIQKLIFSIAEDIKEEEDINEILLENKITLAIACRLVAEKYMMSKLPTLEIDKITHNQTRALSNKYKKTYPTSPNLGIIDRVNLMTPENIHVNSFMYEPLIDMSVNHLLNLYEEVKNLG